MYNIVTAWTSDLENVGSLSNAGLPNIDAKITLINVTTNLIRKIYVLRSCQTQGGKYTFSKILIFAWNLNFIIGKKFYQVVSLEVTGSLCSILRKCLPFIQVWIAIVHLSVILLSKDSVPWKAGYVSLHLSHTSVFPGDNLRAWVFSRSGFCASHLVTENIKKTLLKGQDLIQLIYFFLLRHTHF